MLEAALALHREPVDETGVAAARILPGRQRLGLRVAFGRPGLPAAAEHLRAELAVALSAASPPPRSGSKRC
jgi:hypothetical protein